MDTNEINTTITITMGETAYIEYKSLKMEKDLIQEIVKIVKDAAAQTNGTNDHAKFYEGIKYQINQHEDKLKKLHS